MCSLPLFVGLLVAGNEQTDDEADKADLVGYALSL